MTEFSFPFCVEGGMWDVIVLIPDHCILLTCRTGVQWCELDLH